MRHITAPCLYEGFRTAALRQPARAALEVGGVVLSYAETDLAARTLAAALGLGGAAEAGLVGVLGNRSRAAYLGVLAALARGGGYLPLNHKHPVARLIRVIESSGITALVAGNEALPLLPELLDLAPRPLVIFLPDRRDPPDWARRSALGRHILVPGAESDQAHPLSATTTVSSGQLAYLMFTSGSTGEPKGVAVTHANVRAYTRTVVDLLAARATDRASQMSDLGFDWSVHDLFVAWEAGACLCAVPDAARLAPASFIRKAGITLWAAVPSSIGLLRSMRLLKPGAFPSIRMSVFCGEPLPTSYAEAWQAAAPNSVLENFYGPTETTVAITRYRWQGKTGGNGDTGAIVPIGWNFPGQRHRIVDETGAEAAPGSPGELCFAGSQVTQGYWMRPEETASRYTRLPGSEDTWYRTGDLAREGHDGCLHYLGRIDEQVKVRGFRVELAEVDHVIREAAGASGVASVAWPIQGGSAEGIVTFLSGDPALGVEDLLARCRDRLPDYMVPREIRVLDTIPLTPNGKTDRRRLLQMLDDGR